MKKRIITILIILFTIITGCKSTEIELIESEYEDLIVKEINYNKANKIISFRTENKSNEIITTGLSYTIEKYENEMWNKTNLTDNLIVIQIALLINPNESIEEKIYLSQIDNLSNGDYRINKEYISSSKTINEYIQFKVKDEELINFTSYNKIKN